MTDKIGEYAAKVDAIELEMTVRSALYENDVELAAQLVAQLEPLQGSVMHMRMVRALTVRQTAAELKTSESSVRGLFRRGRDALEAIVI